MIKEIKQKYKIRLKTDTSVPHFITSQKDFWIVFSELENLNTHIFYNS